MLAEPPSALIMALYNIGWLCLVYLVMLGYYRTNTNNQLSSTHAFQLFYQYVRATQNVNIVPCIQHL